MRYKGLIEQTQEMIRIKSLSGEETKIANYIAAKMKEYGYDEVIINDLNTVYGIVKSGRPGKNIMMDGHIDHVVVNDEKLWTTDPFGAEIKDGKMYGRATSDMKGALSAMIYTGKYFAENRELFTGNIIVSGTSWEELFEGYTLGVEIAELKEMGYPIDLVIIGEASELNLKIGQRGRGEVQLISKGKSCHSSNPQIGINAVYNAIDMIKAIKEMKAPVDDFIGEGILELTDMISSPYPGYSVVPEEAKITYDRRLLPGETEKDVLGRIEEVLAPLARKNDKIKYHLGIAEGEIVDKKGKTHIVKKFVPGWAYDREESFVKSSFQGLKNAGIEPKIDKYSFCTNGSMSAGILGIPTIGFGPSRENQAHVVDEYVELDQLEKTYDGYVGIIKEITKE